MTVREYLKKAMTLFNDTYDIIQSMYYNWRLIPLQYTKENNRVWNRLNSINFEREDAASSVERAFERMGELLDGAIREADKKAEAMGVSERARVEKELLPNLVSICKRWMALEKEEVIY